MEGEVKNKSFLPLLRFFWYNAAHAKMSVYIVVHSPSFFYSLSSLFPYILNIMGENILLNM